MYEASKHAKQCLMNSMFLLCALARVLCCWAKLIVVRGIVVDGLQGLIAGRGVYWSGYG